MKNKPSICDLIGMQKLAPQRPLAKKGELLLHDNLSRVRTDKTYPNASHEIARNRYAQALVALGERDGAVLADNVLLCHGAVDALDISLRALRFSGFNDLMFYEPTFPAFRHLGMIHNYRIKSLEVNYREYSEHILKFNQHGDNDRTILLLCAPNNPTACTISEFNLRTVIANFQGFVIIDQTYAEFGLKNTGIDMIQEFENVIFLRSLSKAWERPDLRIGAAIGHSSVINALERVQVPFQISDRDADETETVLSNIVMVRNSIQNIQENRNLLLNEVRSMPNLHTTDSKANFVCLSGGRPSELKDHLMDDGIYTSSVSPAHPCSVRVTVPKRDQLSRLINSLSSF